MERFILFVSGLALILHGSGMLEPIIDEAIPTPENPWLPLAGGVICLLVAAVWREEDQ